MLLLGVALLFGIAVVPTQGLLDISWKVVQILSVGEVFLQFLSQHVCSDLGVFVHCISSFTL